MATEDSGMKGGIKEGNRHLIQIFCNRDPSSHIYIFPHSHFIFVKNCVLFSSLFFLLTEYVCRHLVYSLYYKSLIHVITATVRTQFSLLRTSPHHQQLLTPATQSSTVP